MARANDFKDPDYDRKLEEFKAARDRAKKEMGMQSKEQPKKDSFKGMFSK